MILTVPCQAETEPYQERGDSDASGDHMDGAPASMFNTLVIVLFKHSRETKMVSQFTSRDPKWRRQGPVCTYRPRLCTVL